MSVASRYRQAWEGFWREAPDEPGGVFWDADPRSTAACHLALFEPHLVDAGLALVDLGCGNGTQTRYFAGPFPACDRRRPGRGRPRPRPARRPRRTGRGTGCWTRRRRAWPRRCTPNWGTPTSTCGASCTSASPRTGSPWWTGSPRWPGSAAGSSSSSCRRPPARPRRAGAGPGRPAAKLAPVFRHGIAPGEVADDAVPAYLRTAGLMVLASGELPLVTTEFTDRRRQDRAAVEVARGGPAPCDRLHIERGVVRSHPRRARCQGGEGAHGNPRRGAIDMSTAYVVVTVVGAAMAGFSAASVFLRAEWT